jgi:predicted Zn-dependent protease
VNARVLLPALCLGLRLAALEDDFYIVTPPGPLSPPAPTNATPALLRIHPSPLLLPAPAGDEPVDVRPQLTLGNEHLAANRFFEAGMAFYRAAAPRPRHPEALSGLATSLLLAGDAENALPIFRHLARAHPEEDTYRFNYAATLLRTGDTHGAIEESLALAERTPRDPRVWFNLAQAEVGLERWASAARRLDRVLLLQPDHPMAHLARARVAAELGEGDAIAEHLRGAFRQLGRREFETAAADPAYAKLRESPAWRALMDNP